MNSLSTSPPPVTSDEPCFSPPARERGPSWLFPAGAERPSFSLLLLFYLSRLFYVDFISWLFFSLLLAPGGQSEGVPFGGPERMS